MHQVIRTIVLGAALAWAACPAQAQWYVGASAGESRASFREGSQADQLLALGFLGASTAIDDKGTAYRLHGGYRLHRYLAIELAYADLGKFTMRSTVDPPGFLEASVRSKGAELSALGLLPVGERLTLFARAGAFVARTKASYSGGGSVRVVEGGQSQTKRSTHAAYGVGATYDFTPSLGLRIEWSGYDKLGDELTGGEFDARVVSAGVQWRF